MASFPKAGPRGFEGPIGPAGPQGVQGPTGKEGPQGPDGKGTVGAEGPQGPAGPQGNVGPAGPQGNTGPAGEKGGAGPQGEKGVKGDTGAQGEKGATGAQGAIGPEPTTMPESGVVNLVTDIENFWRQGLPLKEWPGLTAPGLFAFFGSTVQMTTARATRASRFVPWRNMTVQGLGFGVTTLATTNDECSVGIADSTGKVVLGSSPATAGLLNSTTGRKNLDFSADVALTAGNVYYPFFELGTPGGTAAFLTGFSVNVSTNALLLGTAAPDALIFSATPAAIPPPSITPIYTQSNCVSLIVRER